MSNKQSRLSVIYHSTAKGAPDSQSEGGSWSPGADLDVTLRKPFNPAASRLTRLWKVDKECRCLPSSVSPQQGGTVQTNAL